MEKRRPFRWIDGKCRKWSRAEVIDRRQKQQPPVEEWANATRDTRTGANKRCTTNGIKGAHLIKMIKPSCCCWAKSSSFQISPKKKKTNRFTVAFHPHLKRDARLLGGQKVKKRLAVALNMRRTGVLTEFFPRVSPVLPSLLVVTTWAGQPSGEHPYRGPASTVPACLFWRGRPSFFRSWCSWQLRFLPFYPKRRRLLLWHLLLWHTKCVCPPLVSRPYFTQPALPRQVPPVVREPSLFFLLLLLSPGFNSFFPFQLESRRERESNRCPSS